MTSYEPERVFPEDLRNDKFATWFFVAVVATACVAGASVALHVWSLFAG